MRRRHRPWTVRAGDAESLVAEARKALFVMVGFLVILWIIQLFNAADRYQLTINFGIRPHDVRSLPDVVIAPFLHVSWTHIESNSGPLFIFGFLAAYRGVVRFLGLTGLVILVSGFAGWFTGIPHTIDVGASGVVFGYLGYILVRGFFDRRGIDILLGLVMALCFAYQFTVLLPNNGIGWQAHIGGLAAGVVGGWIFRDRSGAGRAVRSVTAAMAPGAAAPGTREAAPVTSAPAADPVGPAAVVETTAASGSS